MPAKAKNNERIVLYVPKEFADGLKKNADEAGLSISAYCRLALAQYAGKKGPVSVAVH